MQSHRWCDNWQPVLLERFQENGLIQLYFSINSCEFVKISGPKTNKQWKFVQYWVNQVWLKRPYVLLPRNTS